MQVEVKIDSSVTEPKIIVLTNKMDDEVNAILQKLSEETPQMIAGFQDNMLRILEQSEIYRVYAGSGKVFAVTEQGEYVLRLRLYELEDRLDKKSFVRISNSEIINLKKAKNFDLSFSGTICVELLNGTVTYVSRRYVSKIKQVLGV